MLSGRASAPPLLFKLSDKVEVIKCPMFPEFFTALLAATKPPSLFA